MSYIRMSDLGLGQAAPQQSAAMTTMPAPVAPTRWYAQPGILASVAVAGAVAVLAALSARSSDRSRKDEIDANLSRLRSERIRINEDLDYFDRVLAGSPGGRATFDAQSVKLVKRLREVTAEIRRLQEEREALNAVA